MGSSPWEAPSALGGCGGGAPLAGQPGLWCPGPGTPSPPRGRSSEGPPGGAHWSPPLALWASSQLGLRQGQQVPGTALPSRSPGRLAGPLPPAGSCVAQEADAPCPREATAQPLPRPPSDRPQSGGSSVGSGLPGLNKQQDLGRELESGAHHRHLAPKSRLPIPGTVPARPPPRGSQSLSVSGGAGHRDPQPVCWG